MFLKMFLGHQSTVRWCSTAIKGFIRRFIAVQLSTSFSSSHVKKSLHTRPGTLCGLILTPVMKARRKTKVCLGCKWSLSRLLVMFLNNNYYLDLRNLLPQDEKDFLGKSWFHTSWPPGKDDLQHPLHSTLVKGRRRKKFFPKEEKGKKKHTHKKKVREGEEKKKKKRKRTVSTEGDEKKKRKKVFLEI